jgi:cytochrome c556
MQINLTLKVVILAITLTALGICPLLVQAADPPAPPPASKYAPAEDLVEQIDFYIKHASEALANKDEYDAASTARIRKDGHTITALALVLGLHDTSNSLKDSAPALIKSSQKLARTNNFDAATAAMAEVKEARDGKGPAGTEPLKWQRAAGMGQLMKEVTSVNAALKRGLTPQRFEQLKKQTAGQAATLAAIAQVVTADTHEVKNPADMDKWFEYCAEMRDAAGAVNAAIHANDQPATTAAMSRLAASCETCHALFRKEAK